MPLHQQKRYARLKSLLQDKICSGTYQPGDRFFSQTELMRRYGLSFSTVMRALDELVREGYLVRKQGKGTFVASTSQAPRQPEQSRIRVAIFTTVPDRNPGATIELDAVTLFQELQSRLGEEFDLRHIPVDSSPECLEPWLFSRENFEIAIFLAPSKAQLDIVESFTSLCSVILISSIAPAKKSQQQFSDAGASSDMRHGHELLHLQLDWAAAAHTATDQLLASGHQHVGLVVPADNPLYCQQCINGYRSALRNSQRGAYDEALVAQSETNDPLGYHATINLFDKNSHRQISAIIACSNSVLTGVQYAMSSMQGADRRSVAIYAIGEPRAATANDNYSVGYSYFRTADICDSILQGVTAIIVGRPSDVPALAPALLEPSK